MHIKRIKKKDAVYLAQYESYREDGKVKTRFIKYIIPEIMGLPDDYFTESAFYSSLDRVCFKDTTADGLTDLSHLICDDIYTRWRTQHPLPEMSREVVAYDLTPVLIFGSGDELGEKGYNSKGVNQKQINLCILVSRWDKIPVSYFLLPGNFNSMSSVKDLLVRLLDLSYEPGTLIWDRGNTHAHSKLPTGPIRFCPLEFTVMLNRI